MKITRELIYSNIDQIMRNSEKVNAKSELSIKELLNDDFLLEKTDLRNIQEIFSILGKSEVTEKSFDEITDEDWEHFINNHTSFKNWEDMLSNATGFYIKKNVFSDILG
ncbi:hypothetical protein [Vibrio sp. VB16]|uniref:hypothetical protein n=1 Tax=Vibrio sp. VB16 TaxID=2785746 RepID=UPI00189E430B|nr:hypothetical protein [Vibrio sp. VB16]UGA54941.1 hypothetical protein IUZ65_000725 [Vibrio sp. VB16]